MKLNEQSDAMDIARSKAAEAAVMWWRAKQYAPQQVPGAERVLLKAAEAYKVECERPLIGLGWMA